MGDIRTLGSWVILGDIKTPSSWVILGDIKAGRLQYEGEEDGVSSKERVVILTAICITCHISLKLS